MDQPDHLSHVEHAHETLVHSHRHHHVTHNWDRVAGTFEHLSSEHEHEHDHPAVTHSHVPHQNFEDEHQGEAHVHDHAKPVAARSSKTNGTTKKATPRKAAATKSA